MTATESRDLLLLGQVLDDNYAVLELVGRGGMGTVYRVRAWDWNLDLAVKVPSRLLISDWVAKERFMLEAETWIELGVHPNIVQCWFIREYQGCPLVYMDFLSAGSLKDWLEKGRVQPGQWELILDLMIQASAGLGYAHELGLVHRDVKPANLLMHEDGRLCVTDFGLVKATTIEESAQGPDQDWERLLLEMKGRYQEHSFLSSLTLTGTSTMLGTPEYGAPEQWIASGNVDTRADIYALGGIFFELCAGRRPFDDGKKRVSTALLLGEHLMTPPPDPRKFNADIPAELARLILRCLAKDPVHRPASMSQIRETLLQVYAEVVGCPYPRPVPRAGAQRADALNNKAVSLWTLGFQQKAFEAWREASKLDGLHPETVYNRSLTQWRQGQLDESEVIRRLTQVKSTYPHLGTYLGYYFLDRGWAEKSEEEIAAALTHPLSAGDGRAWRALGDARMYQEKYPQAVEAYQKAILHMPEDREAQARLEMARGRRRWRERLLFPRSSPHLRRNRKGPINCLALSADGQTAVHWAEGCLESWNVGAQETLWMWHDDSGGSPPNRLTLEGDWVISLESPRGRCWSAHTGQLLLELEGRKRFLAIAGGRALVGGEVLEQVELPSGQILQSWHGHTKAITCAATVAALAITGSADRSVRLWDLTTAECLQVLEGHSDLVEAVLLSADGALAFSGGRDRTVRIWQVATGECLFVLNHQHEVRRLRLSHDGAYLLVGSWSLGEKDQFDCWDVTTGQRLFSGPGGHWISDFRSGPWALVASRVARPGSLVLWDLSGRRSLKTYGEHAGEVTAFSVSRDERWALSGGSDGSLCLWEVDWAARAGGFSLVVNRTTGHDQMESTRQLFAGYLQQARQHYAGGEYEKAYEALSQARALPGYTRDPGALALNAEMLHKVRRRKVQAVWQLRAFDSRGVVTAARLSAEATHALTASGRMLYWWELSSGSCLRGFTGHTDLVQAVALSQDGQLAVSASQDCSLRVWSLKSGECLQVYAFDQPLVDVALDARGGILAATAERLYACQIGEAEPRFAGPPTSIGCLVQSRNGRLALTASAEPGSLALWKLPAAQRFQPWRGEGVNSSGTALALSEDGRYALVGDAEGWLRLYDVEDGHCKLHWQAQQQGITRVALSRDGRVVFSASRDGLLCCWEAATGRCWESLPTEAAELAASPDARFLLTGGSDGVLRLWELDWELNCEPETPKRTSVLERLGGLFRRPR